MSKSVLAVALAAALACPSVSMAQATRPDTGNADRATHAYRASTPIDGQYIVRLRDTTPNAAALSAQLAQQSGAQLLFRYESAIKGFAARMSAAAAQALTNNPNVESVEQDATVSLNATQAGATWGLDRIDQRNLPLNSSYTDNFTGSGIYAFIIDTGIRSSHSEFLDGTLKSRVLAGSTSIADGNGANDCNGHGTHVAGTVGGNTYGVAKAVWLVPVRVLDCAGSGAFSGVIAGIDWMIGQTSLRPAVANMSLGGGLSASVNAAVAKAVDNGITVAVAAGNSNADACSSSPASEPKAITVGATTSTDARASYSNYGACLDVFAPGSSITSSWYTGDSAINTISGTSMASPHVAGVAALALSANPSASPAAVTKFIIDNSTPGLVTGAGTGSPNRMVYSLASGTPTEPVITTVRITAMSGTSKKVSTSRWNATATVTVFSVGGQPVANATVAGSFSNGGGSRSCITSSTGSCSLTSANLLSTTTSTTFTASNVTGSYLSYASGQNTVTQVVIARP